MIKKIASEGRTSAFEIFSEIVPCGLQFGPTKEEYFAIFQDIFERQYYTNHGPLAQKLEQSLADRLQVRHAMCVTNEYIGLALIVQALGIRGKVLLPAASSLATVQPLEWVGAAPAFVDVDPDTGLMNDVLLEQMLNSGSYGAILGVNSLGDACDIEKMEWLANRYKVPLLFDSSQGLGCVTRGGPLGRFGMAEVFSMHADNMINAGQGGVVSTNDDALAAHFRNIRSNYGMGPAVKVAKTSNGRLSEAQAAMALHGLTHLDALMARNAGLTKSYLEVIEGISGLTPRAHHGVVSSNHQNMVVFVDQDSYGLSARELRDALHRERVMARHGPGGVNETPACDVFACDLNNFPGAHAYLEKSLHLPMHCSLNLEGVGKIGKLLKDFGRGNQSATAHAESLI